MFKCCVRQRSSRDDSVTQTDTSEETSSQESSSENEEESVETPTALSVAPPIVPPLTLVAAPSVVPVAPPVVPVTAPSVVPTAPPVVPVAAPSEEVTKISRCTSPVDSISTQCLRCPAIKSEYVEKATEYSPQEVKKDVAINCEIISAAQIDDDDSEKLKSFAQGFFAPKLPPHSGPAYIERTISDGPEEEGDDSVFESCQIKSIVEENAKLQPPAPIAQWLSQEEESSSEGYGGMQEPPATPVARDELALKRHRFFSELLLAADYAAEHKVRFDPLGPTVYTGVESSGKEEQLEDLVIRLENVTSRLEQISTKPTVETQETAVQTHYQIQIQSSTSSEEELPPPPPPPASPPPDTPPPDSPPQKSPPAESPPREPTPSESPERRESPELQESSLPESPPSAPLPPSSPPEEDSPGDSPLPDIPLPGTPPPVEQLSDSAPTISPEEQYSPTLSSVSSDSCVASTVVDTIVEITNMSLAGYQDLMVGPIRDYMNLSAKIGGDVAEHSKLVEKAFEIQFQFIQMSSSRPAPSQSEQMSLLAPTSQQIQKIQEYREKHRGSPYFNHLSAISESIPALGWVAISPTPAPYVKEMNDAGQFYTNRVLKDWKEKDKTHVEWCKAWVQTLTDLQQYVRTHHTTGLVWAKVGAAGVPPPPPPFGNVPPPPPLFANDAPAPGNDDRSALFAEINQGENITKNLRKVTSEMQTHKNPGLRTGPAPFKAPAYTNSNSPVKTVLPANAPIDKPPVFQKDNKKWMVEYQKGNKNLLIDQTEMNNVVYMFRCQDSTLVVKGKVNSIVMDSCRKSSVVFDSVVSSVEFVNCQSVQMQVLGKVPTISVDKTDGCQMYLSADAKDVEIITSKSSEMNIMIPNSDGDYMEYPIPEQFKTTIGAKGLHTVAVDSLG